jgi:hypothetical protein
MEGEEVKPKNSENFPTDSEDAARSVFIFHQRSNVIKERAHNDHSLDQRGVRRKERESKPQR